MTKIKFGTDGWRAVIAKDFTLDNLARVAEGTAQWLVRNFKSPSVVIGHDPRFGGEMFANATATILGGHGVKVFLAKGFVSTPMVSLGTLHHQADMGIVITASHNPPSYNGFKLKGSYGGPLLPEKIEEIENLIPEKNKIKLDKLDMRVLLERGIIEYTDLETLYCRHVEEHFDLNLIRKSGIRFAYDAMYGAGQNVIRRLIPEAYLLHCDHNPSFRGQAPEPIHKNLQEFAMLIRDSGVIDCGLATDGDADRIGLYDRDGNFIDSHHLILLLIKYMVEEKGMKGKVVTAFSVSPKIGKMCAHFGLQHDVTKIGFKYIAAKMISEDVLLGGEESGGIAIKGHIPERDGIWMGLTIWEYMARSGKSLSDLIKEVYDIVGPFAFERLDMHLHEKTKKDIVGKCERNHFRSFGNFKVTRVENTDGYKYFFGDNDWLMIRPSGTEPVLRNYAESNSMDNTLAILKAAEETLLKKEKNI
jgi:phosphomannomutase